MDDQHQAGMVVVTGDVTVDWNIARIPRREGAVTGWNAEETTSAFCHRGGAAMLADFLQAVTRRLEGSKQATVNLRQTGAPTGAVSPDDRRFHHSYAIWEPFDRDERSHEHQRVWRVRQFLGLNLAQPSNSRSLKWQKVINDPLNPDVIVLDDAGLGFREQPSIWPKAISGKGARPWVILKMASPVCRGSLWDHLIENHGDRLILLVSAGDLRKGEVHISSRVSWERTGQDVLWELAYGSYAGAIGRCAQVIVSFGTAGAVLLTPRTNDSPDATLFFDPNAMEGEWGHHHKGAMIGYMSCLAAAVTREVLIDGSAPDIGRGVQAGVRAMRALHVRGYGLANGDPALAFPVSDLAEVLSQGANPLATVRIRNPAETPVASDAGPPSTSYWTILEEQLPASLEAVSQRIVREGLGGALPNVPTGRFGRLTTIDRREIEALSSISGLIREYCQGNQPKPLSIAVFGPPGSGKSFAVKQVAKAISPSQIEDITFNISQFGGPDDLLDAFHQVRDKALSGIVPLVFWDEFDTPLGDHDLGWLRYFLSPMQDGEFLEGQLVHPIGHSIFVFAGGTSHSMETFGADLEEAKRRAAKLPDFVSRLKGFLNILGPNRQAENRFHIIRRAVLLRSILERNAHQIMHQEANGSVVHIDPGLLRAFLLTREYKHGARSMETIVGTSQLAGKTSYDRSSLPTEAQMNLHVDSRNFTIWLHSPELTAELLEKLAEAAHEVFCDDLRAQGYRYGKRTNDARRVHSSLMPYAKLPEDEKDQNRNNVRDIPNKLAAVEHTMIPARGNEPAGEFSLDEIETLSEKEHERWMRQKLDEGWQLAQKTTKAKKLHQCLVSWEKLPDEEREKDRVLVRGMPRILAKAGYTMVKLD